MASILATLGLIMALTTAPLFVSPQAAHASVTTGDLVFNRSTSGGNSQITLRKGSDGSITDLSNPANGDSQPDVSPADHRIAYISNARSGYSELWVMNSDGTGATDLRPLNGPSLHYVDWTPRWSPNGQWIVFSEVISEADGSHSQIDKIRPDGSGFTVLSDTVAGVTGASFNPTWSPDGSKIAFDSDRDIPGSGVSQLFIMNQDGTNLHRITTTQTGYNDYSPVWSPDGTRIYFYSFRGGNPIKVIWYFSSTNGFTSATGPTAVSGSTGLNTPIRLSADGSTLVFSAINGGSCVGIFTLPTAGGTMTPLTDCTSSVDAEPAYVPAAWPNASTKTLVALGDSVAAGEAILYNYYYGSGNDTWVTNGPSTPTWMGSYSQCHQSGFGYPNLVADNGGNYQVYNMACTSATAPSGILGGYSVNGSSVPAQLGWGGSPGICTGCSSPSTVFNGHNPDVVLLTVGADDINFSGWLQTCYTDKTHCSSSAHTTTLNSELSTEKANLRLVLTELNRWAGTKGKTLKVYVTNYYEPYSTAHTSCHDVSDGGVFPGLSVSGTGNALTWIMNGLGSLNSNISSEVTYAQTNDTHLAVHPVNLSSVMAGHEFCTTDPWVYGPSIDYPSWTNGLFPGNPAPGHPTLEGQQAIERAVSTALSS